MPKMTRYERISIIIAITALLLAIASPIVSYFWFDPQLQAFRHRARLQVSGSSITGGNTAPDPVPVFHVQIVNIGELPGKDIRLVVQYSRESEPNPKAQHIIKFGPPVPYEIVNKQDQDFVLISRPLAPQDKIDVSFMEMPSMISVSNEVGETSVIQTPWQLRLMFKDPERRKQMLMEIDKTLKELYTKE